jgi:hypothetical protein
MPRAGRTTGYVPARACLAAWAVAAVAVFGCGGDSLEKAVVSGKITYRGEPIANGDILFYPKPGTDGPVAGASIRGGRYLADGKGGVPVGEHRVEIRAFRVRAASSPLPEGVPQEDLPGGRVQYLPQEFNRQTTLEAVVPPGGRRVEIDFDLKPPGRAE